MAAIAEFILDLLKVVVTVEGRKNIVGFFSIHVKSMMLRKKREMASKPNRGTQVSP